MKRLSFVKTRNVKSPTRGTPQSSGIDFFVPEDLESVEITPKVSEDWKLTDLIPAFDGTSKVDPRQLVSGFVIPPGFGILIPSGIKMIIEPGFDLVFENKSGVAVKKGLVIGAKVIDSDYRGEVHVHVINTSPFNQFVELGEKIAQAVLREVRLEDPVEILNKEFEESMNTVRGEGGFGSTGSK